MNEARQHEMQKLEAMIDKGELYQATRETLALRPPSSELLELLLRCHKTLDEGQPTAVSSL